MYQGNYDSRDKKTSSRDKGTARFRWRKEFVLLVSVFVMIAGVVGGTIAYLTSHAEIINTFSMAKVSCQVNSNQTITNTSDIPAYIRAAVVVTWKDSEGNIYGQPVNYTVTLGEGWTQSGDYYYYEPELDAKGEGKDTTTALTVTTSDNAPTDENGEACTPNVEILAEAIQSEPIKAIQEAWGYTPSNNQ